jgi:hypothetical protein
MSNNEKRRSRRTETIAFNWREAQASDANDVYVSAALCIPDIPGPCSLEEGVKA